MQVSTTRIILFSTAYVSLQHIKIYNPKDKVEKGIK